MTRRSNLPVPFLPLLLLLLVLLQPVQVARGARATKEKEAAAPQSLEQQIERCVSSWGLVDWHVWSWWGRRRERRGREGRALAVDRMGRRRGRSS
jgi:hypothetical protein